MGSKCEEDLAVCLIGPSHRLLVRSNHGDMVRTTECTERSKVRETEHRGRDIHGSDAHAPGGRLGI